MNRAHKAITLHIWRAGRSVALLVGAAMWLDWSDWPKALSIFSCLVVAALFDQFKGYVCNTIEKIIHWNPDFDNWF